MKEFLFLTVFSCLCQLSASDTQLIGVYSGSFDPPTKAHNKIITAAIEREHVDKLIIYLNQFGKKPYQSSLEDRKEMLELMLKDKTDCVSVVVQSNRDKRIDYDHIKESGKKMALLIGEDSYFKRLSLPEEQRIPVDKIFVIPRTADFSSLRSSLRPDAEIFYIPDIQHISSTSVRQKLNREEINGIQLDEIVLNYILSKGLYTTKTAKIQQLTSDLPTLLIQAKETQSRLGQFLDDFAATHDQTRTYIPGVKSIETIQNLLKSRWHGDASMITDFARATLSFTTLQDMYRGLDDLKETGLDILKITDNFVNPCLGGYRDITIIFRDPINSHLAEIQLNLHTLMEFKNGLGTSLFHVIRELQSIPAIEKRPLTQEEEICLSWLFERERLGYDAALKKAEVIGD